MPDQQQNQRPTEQKPGPRATQPERPAAEGRSRGSDAEAEPSEPLVPTLSLPSGGGALRNIGEKFSANAFTGSGGVSVAFPASPARALTPSIGVSYSSGSGNGPFGLGWRASVPSITRKTDRGLPRYIDEPNGPQEPDTFIISEAEDLVPLLTKNGSWGLDTDTRDGHAVTAYRPRVEGAFSRIERWVNETSGVTHWRTWSRDNVVSIFGQSGDARISKPGHPDLVFTWLLEETRDDKGNVVVFEYKQEDLDGVDTAAPEERERLAEQTEQAQRYIKRIKYGNVSDSMPYDFKFEVVFDYGEHDADPTAAYAESTDWDVRVDTFSSYRSGFDIRTRRLCQRILMFHDFSELQSQPQLVRALEFSYTGDGVVRRLESVQHIGYGPDGSSGLEAGEYPPIEFEYSLPAISDTLGFVDGESLEGVPGAVDGSAFRLVDLDGEGVPGILSQQGRALWFKPATGAATYGPSRALPTMPSNANLATQSLLDLDGDGRRSLVAMGGTAPGYFDRTAGALAVDEEWAPFQPLRSVPRVRLEDPNVQLIDLDGDGLSDILVAEESRFVWYRSLGDRGFDEPLALPRPTDDRAGPSLVYRDPQRAIFYADMSGDGLTDIVRLENGSVTYWPNLGRGKFGRAVSMSGAPRFDRPDKFRTDRVRLGDTDGSGTADIIYLGFETTRLYRNESGNSWSDAIDLNSVPPVDSAAFVELSDVLGTGTAALVWSTQLPNRKGRQVAYLDLAAEGKPYLLIGQKNNMGLETRVRYASSTKFYLADKLAGNPWRTRLPFPVQVVERVEVLDRVAGHLFAKEYRYRHGYFDGPEREFRGFGYVETEDVEVFSDYTDQGLFDPGDLPVPGPGDILVPPVLTKTWYHTGAYIGLGELSKTFADEYYPQEGSSLPSLPDTPPPVEPGDATMEAELTPIEMREAVRALKGRMLRSEVYSSDGSSLESHPYSVAESNFTIVRLQPREGERYASFFVHERESLAFAIERDVDNLRLSQSATLEVDELGNVLRTVAVAYGRTSGGLTEQGDAHVVLSEQTVFNQVDPEVVYRLGTPNESRSYELYGDGFVATAPKSWADLRTIADGASEIAYDENLTAATQKRLLTHSRQYYYADDLTGPLTLGTGPGARALPHHNETLAFTQAYLAHEDVLDDKVPSSTILENEGGYVLDGGAWWTKSGRAVFDSDKFYLPVASVDPFGNQTDVTYDAYDLIAIASEDALGNVVSATIDYRVLAASLMVDSNDNQTEVEFDARGMVVKTAIMGKSTESLGDTLANPSVEFEYDLFAWSTGAGPVFAKTKTREIHFSDSASTPFQESYAYSSGAGAVIMTKVQAEPGLAPERDGNGELILDMAGEPTLVDTSPSLRYIGTGRTIIDNRGNPIKQYEPYFSSIPDYEDESELVDQGVTPVLHYDPLGRLVRTDLPNGTFSKVEFSPWESTSWDPNDTVEDSEWYSERIGYAGSDPSLLAEKRAAELAATHRETPTRAAFDALGRTIVSYAHNGFDNDDPDTGNPILFETKSVLDVQGNVLQVIDARGNIAEERRYGQLGQVLRTTSRDAGDRWALQTVDGQALRTWDSRDQAFRTVYDELRRPVDQFVDDGTERLLQRTVYGEALSTPKTTNHRGRAYAVYDGAGRIVSDEYDFKGNLLQSTRALVVAKTGTPDWDVIEAETTPGAMATAAASSLEGTDYELESTFDALNRVVTATSPENQSVRSIVEYTYQERGLLDTVGVKHRGSSTATGVVTSLTYDVKGRREQLDLGNGLVTTYAYDEKTYRVTRILTTRTSDSAVLQDLNYHYDPVGNVVEIRDLAQQTVYFSNSSVDPSMKYGYDALYRLTQAEGREHEDAGAGQLGPQDIPRISNVPDPNNPEALLRYTQTYEYDEVGNILEMVHSSTAGGWTRLYNYDVDGNRLWSTSAPGDSAGTTYTTPGTETYSDVYTYDAHGNMTQMPHTGAMAWNALDELESVAAGSTVSHYQYAGGNRVRKFVERTNGSVLTDERIYVGPFELYRRENGSGVTQETESLHVSDDTGRILLVETRVAGGTAGRWGAPWGHSTRWGAARSSTPFSRWRYQLSNHLGSASAEVDENGAVISYEEYHPYGTTAYRAADSQTEVSAKRYRYTGKEKDEETGLYYHGARYYACWLGRWTAADPSGLEDGNNRFRYVDNNPVKLFDPDGRKGFTAELFASARKIGSDIQEGVQAKLDQRQADIEKFGSNSPETLQGNKDFVEKKNTQAVSQAVSRSLAGRETNIVSDANLVAKGVDAARQGTPTGLKAGPVLETIGGVIDAGDVLNIVPNPARLIENPVRESAENTPLVGNFVRFQDRSESAATKAAAGDRVGAGIDIVLAVLEGAEAVGVGFGGRALTGGGKAGAKVLEGGGGEGGRRTIVRALNPNDARQLEAGLPVLAEGSVKGQKGIALQVQGETATGFISASDDITKIGKFIGPEGVIEIDVDKLISLGSGIVENPNILQAIRAEGLPTRSQDLQNARDAAEVLIKDEIPLEAIVRRFFPGSR